ncbi:hypothetical protein AB8970_19785 [Yersinia enterocolitica]|nr:hypothetical protein [Yersinia enterocolitica]
MALAMERKRLISSSLYFLLWIIAVMPFYFSKKILINTISWLLEITKSGKKYLSGKIIIQINLTGLCPIACRSYWRWAGTMVVVFSLFRDIKGYRINIWQQIDSNKNVKSEFKRRISQVIQEDTLQF